MLILLIILCVSIVVGYLLLRKIRFRKERMERKKVLEDRLKKLMLTNIK